MPDLTRIKLTQLEFSIRTRKLVEKYYPDATIASFKAMSNEEVLRNTGFGPRSLQEIRYWSEQAEALLLTQNPGPFRALRDGIQEMVNSGRLTEEKIPDDWDWLQETLQQCFS